MKQIYIEIDPRTKLIKNVFSKRLYEGLIETTIEDDVKIHILQDKWVNNQIVSTYDDEEESRKDQIRKEIQVLKTKLAASDYLAIKFTEGELTEEEFAPHREERKAWRARINELEEEL